MISRVKYGLKIGVYKMRKITAYFANDVNDLAVRKKVYVESRGGGWSNILQLAKGDGI